MATTQVQTLRGISIMPSLTVDNIQASQKFFEALGFEVEEKWEEKGALTGLMLKAGKCRLGVNQDDGKKGTDRVKGVGMSLYIEVDDDIDRIAATARANGITIASGPNDIEWGSRAFRVIEPSGFAITIMSPEKR